VSPLDVTPPDFYQARIVSRIALCLASDGGAASRAAIEPILSETAEKQGASASNSYVFVTPP
jgi:hypothetical protein